MIKRGHDPWTTCDSCGFKVRRSKTRKTWKGTIVCADTCWDEKFPKSAKIPSVIRPNPDVRPQISAAAGTTTLASNAAQFATSIVVTSITGMLYLGDIGIVLDNGLIHWTHITVTPSTTTITFNDRLPSAASSGNTVYVAGKNRYSFGAKVTTL